MFVQSIALQEAMLCYVRPMWELQFPHWPCKIYLAAREMDRDAGIWLASVA